MIFRNITSEDLDLPTLGLRVGAGESVEVTGDAAQSLLAADLYFTRTDKPVPRSDSEEN